ncbi:uncharacterized protein CEXT_153491 [Caerostris extrusa]|uniref:Uncharacterized protein n=1 Tax=Caerostris extrusa TaxID=172846 RepID=A0AAV4WX96_CAEEX|nr:uncharacterized protein CEXT_153491 [Caerostris extrusa]
MLISGRTLEGQPDQRKGDSGLIELPASLIIPDFDQWSAVDRKRPQANAPGCHRDLFKSQDLETPRCPRALLLKGIYCYLCGNAPALFDDIDTLRNRFNKRTSIKSSTIGLLFDFASLFIVGLPRYT